LTGGVIRAVVLLPDHSIVEPGLLLSEILAIADLANARKPVECAEHELGRN
jgi:hypothetical protein